jgi:hypothetical protein
MTMSEATDPFALDPEDSKLVTLARGARERTGAAAGAAVRDETGRTYAAADALMPSFPVTALQLAVAQAWASGARGLEAAVVVTAHPQAPIDARVVVDLAGGLVPILVCAADGTVSRAITSGAPDCVDEL